MTKVNKIKENKMRKLVETLNVMGKEPDFKEGFNTNGVWTYFYTYQSKDIPQVGIVTKDFWSWQGVYYCVDAYLRVQADESYPNRAAVLNYLASVLEIQFKWLTKEVKLGTEFRASMKPEFVSPLITYQPENAPMVEAICPSAVTEAIDNARKMYFQAPSRKLMSTPHKVEGAELMTFRNLMAFCRVMEKAGRLGQEGTIDSVKTALMPSIELIEEMEKVVLKSRRGDFGIQLDFEKKFVDIKCNDLKSYVAEGRYYMADILDVMRISAIRNAIPKETAEKVFALQQTLDVADLGMAGKYTAPIQLCMQLYRSLRDCQNADFALARKEAGSNTERIRAAEANIKGISKIAYNALTSMTQTIFGNMDNVERVKKVLSVTLHNMGKDANRPSSFVGIIMAEEFFEYILSQAGEGMAMTHDELEGCDAEDGEVVEFKDGVVAGRAIYTHEVKPIPDGTYTVRKDGKHAWVEAPIVERIHQRIAERPQGRQLMFQTRGVKNVKAVMAAINGAKKVVLVPYAVINGKKVYDAVIADGKIVCQFICKVAGEGKEYAVSKEISDLYRSKYGRVAYCHPISYKKNGGTEDALLVAVDNVHFMCKAELDKAVAEAQVIAEFGEPEKKVATTARGALAALKAKAAANMAEEKKSETTSVVKEEAPAQPEEAKEAPQLTLMQRLMAKRNKIAEKPAAEKKYRGLARLREAGADIQ